MARLARLARTARPEALASWLPVALVVLAEAAWISVLEGFLQAFAGRPPALGLSALALFVVGGLAVARLAGRRLGRWWPALALTLFALAAGSGVLLAPDARAGLDAGPLAAAAAHPGGVAAGLAVLRGFAHARLPIEEGTVGRLLGVGVPGITVFALVGSIAPEPGRSDFLAAAFTAAVVFVASGVLAMTIARLAAVDVGSRLDWRRNPSWLATTAAVLALAVVAAVPLAAVAGRVIATLVAIGLAPMLVLGLTMGLDRTGRRVIGFVLVGGIVVFAVLSIFGGSGGLPPEPPAQGGVVEQPTAADNLLGAGLGGLLLVAVVVAILVLAALWMRRGGSPEDDLVEETRRIDRGPQAAPRRRRRWGRRPDPVDAASAYVALVDDLAGHPAVERRAGETPAEHAARLRGSGRGDLRLNLLAADYALARYADFELPPREDRRAIGRWRVLRRALRRPVRPAAGDPRGTTPPARPRGSPPP